MIPGLINLSEQDLAELVPECYAGYRPIVVEGLRFFLERLTPQRIEAILAHQEMIAPAAPPALRLVRLLHDCPTLHKLGQIIARHQQLDKSLRGQLEQLESIRTATTVAQLEPLLRGELGDSIDRYRIEFGAEPLAEASVAIVIPCRWRVPETSKERDGVLKILKPTLVEHLPEELAILAELADFIDSRREAYDLPRFEYRETFDSVRSMLEREVQLDREQEHLREASAYYENSRRILIPHPLPFCTPRLTAMERVFGTKAPEATGREGGQGPRSGKRRIAQTLVESLLADVIFSRSETAIFHADPHAGNIFATDDGRVALLDWSLIGRLTKPQRISLCKIIMGAAALSESQIASAISELAEEKPDPARLREPIEGALRSLRQGRLPGPTWIAGLMDGVLTSGARFPADLLMLRKSLFTLHGVIEDISPDFPLDRFFFTKAISSLIREWPFRIFGGLRSRDFSTNVSNADLLRAYASTPVLFVNYLAQTFADRGRTKR